MCKHALYLSGTSPWKRPGSGQATWDTKGGDTRNKTSGRFWRKPKKKRSAPADFTHRRRRTGSALHWRWGEGCKNSERSRVCSHTSHSYSTRGPGTHSHLQRAPQTLVTVGTCGQGQLWLQVVDTITYSTAAKLPCYRIFWLCTAKPNLQIVSFAAFTLLLHCVFRLLCPPFARPVSSLSDTACMVVSGLYLEYCTWSRVPMKVYW